MTRWIGLSGKMGSGKDYTYHELLARGHDVTRVSFADSLRFEIEGTLKLSKPITKPYTELERKLQQWWGTDFRRAQDPDYWVKVTETRATNIEADTGTTPVFTDVRFPNEADMIRRHGGLIVRMTAHPQVRKARIGMEPPNHESETALDEYEFDLHIPSDMGSIVYESALTSLEKMAGPP